MKQKLIRIILCVTLLFFINMCLTSVGINQNFIDVKAASSTTKLEAENGTLSGGAAKATKYKGYTGKGYVALPYKKAGAALTLKLNSSKKANTTLNIRYANGSTSKRTATVYLNGKAVKAVSFASTKGWTKWSTTTLAAALKSGTNTIAVKVGSKDSGSINIDYVQSSIKAETKPKTMAIGTNFWFLASWTGEKPFKDGVDFKTTTDPWNPEFLEELAPYSVLRFMDWNVTNMSGQKSWDTRRQKTDIKQEAGTGGMNGEPGLAYEWMFDLSNRTKTDCWITVPHLTIEDYDANPNSNYYTELAKLAKKELDKDRKLYIEYSNEIWNTGFEQSRYVTSRGGPLFHLQTSLKLFKAFKDVFGEERDRVKFVLSWFVHDVDFTQSMVDGLNDKSVNKWGVKPDYYAIAPYVGHEIDGASPTLEKDWDEDLKEVVELTKRQYNALKGSGIELIAYEFGQHILKNADAFAKNPKAYDMYMKMLDSFKPYYSIMAHYAHCGNWSSGGSWGAKKFTGQPIEEAHKYRALVDWINKNK